MKSGDSEHLGSLFVKRHGGEIIWKRKIRVLKLYNNLSQTLRLHVWMYWWVSGSSEDVRLILWKTTSLDGSILSGYRADIFFRQVARLTSWERKSKAWRSWAMI